MRTALVALALVTFGCQARPSWLLRWLRDQRRGRKAGRHHQRNKPQQEARVLHARLNNLLKDRGDHQ